MKVVHFYFLIMISFCLSSVSFSQVDTLLDSPNLSVQKKVDFLNKQIKEEGFNWKARITSKSNLTQKQMQNLCGVKMDNINTKNNLMIQDSLYRNYKMNKNKSLNKTQTIPDWKSLMSPIEDQECGNCWAHAATGVTEGLLHQLIGSNLGIDLDEMWITYNSGCGDCIGGYTYCALNYIKNNRTKTDVNQSSYPNLPNSFYGLSAISSNTASIEGIISTLQTSPVLATMYVYSDFFSYSSGIYRHTSGTGQGYHAVVILGYNDDQDYWICKNSWGDDWGEDGYFKIAFGECGIDTYSNQSANVNQSSLAKIVPNLINTLNTAFSYGFGSGEFAYHNSGSTSLTSNITVPSGITLSFLPDCSVNFNGYRIIVNGSVSGESNINCAYLKQSGGTLKGLYPTAQYAINYASASDIVELQARTYSENLSMKSGVSVYGGAWDKTSTVINGTVSFSSVSSATLGYVTVNSYIQNTYGGSNDIFNVLAKGPIYYSYNTYSDIEEVDMLESNSYGISAGYSTLYPWYNNIKNKSTAGINADHSTIINESNTFCNNTLDVRSNYWSDVIDLYGCYFSNSTPGSTVSGPGTFYWDYWYAANCGSPKLSSPNEVIGEDLKSSLENLSNDKKILGSEDYKKAKDSYKTLFNKIAKENRKKVLDFKNYETELNDLILQFRELIKTYPGSETSFNSLQVVLDCYRSLGKYEEAKNLVNELLADKTFGEIKPNIKLLSLPLIINDQNYDEALSLCNEVMGDIPNSSEAVFMLYNKGVIYETLKKDKISAENTFGELMEKHPNSIYGDFASKYLGKENNKELAANKQIVYGFECSNFPNPFNPTTTISYTLPEKSFVTLKVFDILGREVSTLVNGIKESGEHKASFNASNLPSGVYIYSIQAGTYRAVKKMLLVK